MTRGGLVRLPELADAYTIGRMWPRVDGMRAFGLGDRGAMRRRLTESALAGMKVATGDLLQPGYLDEGEAVEKVGERQVLLGEDERPAAVVEIVRVETHEFAQVPWEFADAEGEDFRSIEHWRSGHRSYYAEHGIDVGDEAPFVCVWFRVLDVLAPTPDRGPH